MSVLLQLFTSFFAIGCFSFGGGYAVLSFLQQEAERQGWMTTERFADLVAVSQSTPGPIAINMATFTGYQVGGVAGSLVATVAVSLPGIVLVLLFSFWLFRYYERPGVQAVLSGLRPAVVGLIAAAAWRIAEVSIIGPASAVMALAALLLIGRRVHPAWVLAAAAAGGMLLL